MLLALYFVVALSCEFFSFSISLSFLVLIGIQSGSHNRPVNE